MMMNKQIYLVRGMKHENHQDFTQRILKLGKSIAEDRIPASLKVTLTDQPPPTLSIIPFKKKKIAAFSIVSELNIALPEFLNAPGFAGAFKVDEAIPVGYEKEWKDGEKTPGIGLLTLFHRKKGIDHPTFIDRWHNSHTPLSLRIHPLWNYNRNVVEKKLSDHPFWYDGIVEEHFRTRKDLLNIFRFFGKPHKMLYNMFQVYTDTNSFLDYKKIETYLVSEYHIVS